MKLDLKSIAVIILSIFVILFAGAYFLGGSNHKKEIKELEKENIEIENQKKLIDKEISSLKDSFKVKELRLKSLEESESILKERIKEKDIEIEKSKRDLENSKMELIKTKKLIENLEKNPNYKNGDNLINSIREKTK